MIEFMFACIVVVVFLVLLPFMIGLVWLVLKYIVFPAAFILATILGVVMVGGMV